MSHTQNILAGHPVLDLSGPKLDGEIHINMEDMIETIETSDAAVGRMGGAHLYHSTHVWSVFNGCKIPVSNAS